MAQVLERDDHGVRLLTLDNPPLNPLSDALLEALTSALSRAEADGVDGLVLCGAGDTFVAGADIRRLEALARGDHLRASSAGDPEERPRPALGELILRLEDWGRPVVAAIDGFALGGGLELALGCHHRVATATARLGLPELSLGLIPGAGGTQRLPRLIGLEAAIEVMLSSRQLTAQEALTRGLVDELAERAELLTASVAQVRRLVGTPLRRARLQRERLVEGAAARLQVQAARGQLTPSQRRVRYPTLCLDAILAGVEEGAECDLQVERACFTECLGEEAAAGMIYLFFAARGAGKRGVPGAEGLMSRVLSPLAQAAEWLAHQGVSPLELERELEDFGFAAPSEAGQVQGQAPRAEAAPGGLLTALKVDVQHLAALCQGRSQGFRKETMAERPLGLRAGAGAQPAHELHETIAQAPPRGEWVRRLLLPLVSEACQALAEGAVSRASEVDLALHRAAGFPRFRGGPLKWADRLGPPAVLAELKRWHAESEAAVFQPSAALEAWVSEGRRFTADR